MTIIIEVYEVLGISWWLMGIHGTELEVSGDRIWIWTDRHSDSRVTGNNDSTLWLCQNSYWKWPFIVDFPIKNGGSFHSYVSLPEGKLIYQSWLAEVITVQVCAETGLPALYRQAIALPTTVMIERYDDDDRDSNITIDDDKASW